MDDYTQPERRAERESCRAVREAVRRAGGCAYCTRRTHHFDTIGRLAACGLDPPRAFPACVGQSGGFEFDEAAYRGQVDDG